MTVQHRMPTTRRAMERDRLNSSIRKMTLEDRIVQRIWDGDVQEVTLFIAVARLAVERIDYIFETARDMGKSHLRNGASGGNRLV